MRLLYICGTYAPGAFAGSELSVHQLLRELSERHSVDVLVATDSRYTGGHAASTTYEGVPIRGIDHEDRYTAICQEIDEYQPSAILTQLLWADVALSTAKAKGVPAVLRIASTPTNIDLSIPTAIVTNSEFNRRWILEKSGRHAYFIEPFVDLERVLVAERDRMPRLIIMFNPIREKGGHIFREIARAMPDRRFGVVPGWNSLRKPDGTWDQTTVRRSIESQGYSDLDWIPEDIQFSDLPNVEVLRPREEVSEIFAQARILLVPSQWDEAFARVCIEAYANGIPVVGSAVAGLEEHLKIAGIAIEDKSNVNKWIDAIKLLDDPNMYQYYSLLSRQYVERFYNRQTICDNFVSLISHTINKQAADPPKQ